MPASFLADSTCNQHVKQQSWIKLKVSSLLSFTWSKPWILILFGLQPPNEPCKKTDKFHSTFIFFSFFFIISTELRVVFSFSVFNAITLMYLNLTDFMQCLAMRKEKLKSKKSNHVPWCGANLKIRVYGFSRSEAISEKKLCLVDARYDHWRTLRVTTRHIHSGRDVTVMSVP